jgi:hypothetical protein
MEEKTLSAASKRVTQTMPGPTIGRDAQGKLKIFVNSCCVKKSGF